MVIASILLASVLSAAPADADTFTSKWVPTWVPKRFESRELNFSAGPFQDQSFNYRLLVPKSLPPHRKCPLLVWLHGGGESGRDNMLSLRYLNIVLEDKKDLEDEKLFILVPQCPSTAVDWDSKMLFPHPMRSQGQEPGQESGQDQSLELQGQLHEYDMLDVTYEMIQDVMKNYPIDPDRVSMLGICSGGNGCWAMAMRHPDLFAAMSPMSGGYSKLVDVGKITNLPIWAFHNLLDHPELMKVDVNAVKQAGGDAYLTLVVSAQHGGWQAALHRYNAVDWLIAQTRGTKNRWLPPGLRPWRWWHVLTVPLAFVLLVSWGWYSEYWRRHRKRQAAVNSPELQSNKPDN
jgi:predicted peptidase